MAGEVVQLLPLPGGFAEVRARLGTELQRVSPISNIWKPMEVKAGYAAITLMEAEEAEKLFVFHGTGLACLDPRDGKEMSASRSVCRSD